MIRRARGYSMLWVKHTFRARIRVWVEDAGTDLMQYPDAERARVLARESCGRTGAPS